MLKKRWVLGAAAATVLAAAMLCGVGTRAASAQERAGGAAPAPARTQDSKWLAIAIAISIGASCLGAGYAVGRVGAAALGAASEKPELITRSLLFVALAEGIAIYGLLIAVLLWIKL